MSGAEPETARDATSNFRVGGVGGCCQGFSETMSVLAPPPHLVHLDANSPSLGSVPRVHKIYGPHLHGDPFFAFVCAAVGARPLIICAARACCE